MDKYEKLYNEALERAQKATRAGGDVAMDIIQYIFPELAESEDERIRAVILKLVLGMRDEIFTTVDKLVTKPKVLAWLKKQKINTEGDFGRGYDCGYQAGYAIAKIEMKPKVATATLDSEKQKEQKPNIEICPHSIKSKSYLEQKPVEPSEFKTKLAEYLQNNSPKDGKYVISSESILEMAKEELIKRGELQKPVESEVLNDAFNASKQDFTLPEKKVAVEYADAILPTSIAGGESEDAFKIHKIIEAAFIAGQNFQKPVEWSEEDEKMRDRLITRLTWITYNTRTNDTSPNITFFDEIDWLKVLSLNRKKINEDVEKLCSNEWSQEDEDRIRQIERIAQQAGCTQKLQEEIHDWLKSLRPSWKPSEEQMNALNALNCHGDLSYVGQQNQLISLYNDLKKLM